MNSKKKVVLVTGGSRGIGKAICQRLAKEGYIIIANYLSNKQAADSTVSEIERDGGIVTTIQASVESEEEVQRMVNLIIEKYGQIDILINNAGIIRDRMLFLMKEEDWKKVISINLVGSLLCTKAVLKSMIKHQFGRIINISSVSGLMGTKGQTNYSTSKAALIGFTRSLAKEIAQYNINVNAIAAGYIETEMVASINPTQLQIQLDNIPQRKFAKAPEIASVVHYLISQDANYITGQTIVVDGGLTLM